MFRGLAFVVCQFIVTLYIIQRYAVASSTTVQRFALAVVFEFIGFMLIVNIWGRRFPCPRCGQLFFWPDQWKPIAACVHCGLPLAEIVRLGGRVPPVL